MFKNSAAWLTSNKARPLQVKSAPYTRPREAEIVIRNYATAINPIDWRIQDMGTAMMYKWIEYPCILGSDVAGEVVEVGPQVTRFKVGDRVVGQAVGKAEIRNRDAEGAFQLYVVLLDHMVSPIPDSLPYENAAVIPLAVATAACGLFQADQLGLQLPSASPKLKGETLLIWGGSTSVGSCAIQLAVAAVKAFDYNSRTVVDDIVKAFQGKTSAGAITMASAGTERCMDILNRCSGKKFVSLAAYPVPVTPPKHFQVLQTMFTFITRSFVYWFKSKTMGVNYNLIFATTLIENGIGKSIFADYLPHALKTGKFQASPEPMVVANGLEGIQDAMDYQKTGVSARKVVVSLKN